MHCGISAIRIVLVNIRYLLKVKILSYHDKTSFMLFGQKTIILSSQLILTVRWQFLAAST